MAINAKQLEKCRKKALKAINLYLDIMLDDEKAGAAPINQLASAIGVLSDRFLKDTDSDGENGRLEEILSVIKEN